jgi:hypothetical protein
MHIGRRMRRIALQSAAGGMAISVIGMGFAVLGFVPPIAGALLQEFIDLGAVLNSLRMAIPPKSLADYHDLEGVCDCTTTCAACPQASGN